MTRCHCLRKIKAYATHKSIKTSHYTFLTCLPLLSTVSDGLKFGSISMLLQSPQSLEVSRFLKQPLQRDNSESQTLKKARLVTALAAEARCQAWQEGSPKWIRSQRWALRAGHFLQNHLLAGEKQTGLEDFGSGGTGQLQITALGKRYTFPYRCSPKFCFGFRAIWTDCLIHIHLSLIRSLIQNPFPLHRSCCWRDGLAMCAGRWDGKSASTPGFPCPLHPQN